MVFAVDQGIPSLTTGPAVIAVKVQRNKFAPVFQPSQYAVVIREDINIGSSVITVNATDKDTIVSDFK